LGSLRPTPAPSVWVGPECSFLTVGDWPCDQLALTGHDRRIEDLDLLAELGATAVRLPILWGRSDVRGVTDWRWAEERTRRAVDLGLRPVAGLLHHGFGPAGRDPLDPGWPAAFGRFAGAVASRLPVETFLPINEPLTTARFGALYGWWSPYARDASVFASLLLAECHAWLMAARAIRRVRPAAQLVVNEDIGRTVGTPRLAAIVAHHNDRRWLTFDLLTGRVDPSHPLWPRLGLTRDQRRTLDLLRREPIAPDILGLDHYMTSDRFLDDRLDRYPGFTHAVDGDARYADVELVRVGGEPHDGFARAIRDAWQRYRLPVALTEVQLAGEPHDRAAWWREAWSAAEASVADGIPVRGVTAWSTFGAYDWSSVLRHPCGAYEPGCFDVSGDGPPRRTALADVVGATARGLRDDAELVPGWWRRDNRVLYPLEAAFGERAPAERSAEERSAEERSAEERSAEERSAEERSAEERSAAA
jgi:dTDP-4-dehydrorhamnose reductase